MSRFKWIGWRGFWKGPSCKSYQHGYPNTAGGVNALTSMLNSQPKKQKRINPFELKILHDFDNAYPSGRWALKRGLRLVLYAFSRFLPFLKHFCSDIYRENYDNAFTLLALNDLVGVEGLFGINDRVAAEFLNLRKELGSLGARTIRHWHAGTDAPRWDPELDVSRRQWWFDQEYAAGKRTPSTDDWIVFHCDYPHLLPAYISCLHELVFGRQADRIYGT
jgi:hypothetical protein